MSNSLVPELSVTDCAQSLTFYCNVLGFEIVYQRQEEGFAYLRHDQAELMLDQIGIGRDFDTGLSTIARPLGRGINLQIQTGRLADLVSALHMAGIPLLLPVEEKWYRHDSQLLGNRQFIVADPDGYLLRFYQNIGRKPL